MIVSLIAAYVLDPFYNKVIGKDNKIPWHSSSDLRRFKEYTSNHPIIMGRKTFQSIGKCLPKRQNIILTGQQNYEVPGGYVVSNIEDALSLAKTFGDEIFIIGGEEVYNQTLHRADRLYLTNIKINSIEGDSYFPTFNNYEFAKIHEEENTTETFYIYERKISCVG